MVGDHERAGTRVGFVAVQGVGAGPAGGEAAVGAYREEGLNDVRLDGAERFVSDDDEDLLLFLKVDEVTEPGFLGEPAPRDEEKEKFKKTKRKSKHPRCHTCSQRVFVFLTPLSQRHIQSSIHLFYPSATAAPGRRKQRIPQRK